MSNYKDTLNLPQTQFAMKANLAEREPVMQKRWEESDLYQKIRDARKGAPTFILHDGPPYANGHLHCGHAVNKILKDIIIKSKTLAGYDSPYVPGWDCHGLPIELNVEKKFGKPGTKLSQREFRQKCREYATSQIDIQRDEFKRLGVLGDWDHPYITMDFRYEANIMRALGKVIGNGHLVQGFKPVYWCLDCRSALAEAEVEYEDKHSPALDVRFRLLDESDLASRIMHKPQGIGVGPIAVPIWTTTPWTLPANQAVSVNPEIEYALVEGTLDGHEQRFIIAHALLTHVMQRYGISQYRVVATLRGKSLEGLKLQHPFYDRIVPIICGEHVTTDVGTGNVHTAPAHGVDDYNVAKHYHLPLDNPVSADGRFFDDVEFFGGLHVLKANEAVMEVLSQKGNLIHAAAINHSYPHCWRHKTPIIFLATPQWFISMEKQGLRESILSEIKKVKWIPEWGQARIATMMEQRPDWCVSRQRTWGVPIPLFIHKETRALHPATATLIETVAKRVEEHGIDAWFDSDAQDFLEDDAHLYDKATDTLDVWFDSGVSHFAVLAQDPRLRFPADLYLEGSDQHRGWFNSSITSSVAMTNQAPYKTVLTHGFAVDGKGYKLSKSRGNYVELGTVVKQYGADVLRLWVCSADYRAELAISDEILKRISDAYRRIRNTARFLLANLFDFDPKQHSVPLEKMVELDRWVVEHARQLQTQIVADYDHYSFHQVFHSIHQLCSMELGSFYLDIIKDRQYTTKTNSHARRSCQTAMYHLAMAMVRWLAPIISFTADEIWQAIPGTKSELFTEKWYEFPKAAAPTFEMSEWQWRSQIRSLVNKELEMARAAGVLGSGLEAEVTLYADEVNAERLAKLGNELRFVLITSKAEVQPLTAKSSSAKETEMDGLWIDVLAATAPKCARCWHRRDDVGQNAEHPELCLRCVDNVSGEGETREMA